MFDRERYKKIIESYFLYSKKKPEKFITPEKCEEIASACLIILNKKKYYRVMSYKCSNTFSKLGHYIYTRYKGNPSRFGNWRPPVILNEIEEKMDTYDREEISNFLGLLAWRILELDRDHEESYKKDTLTLLVETLDRVVKQKAMKIAV